MKYCKDIFESNKDYWLRDIDADIVYRYNYMVGYDTYMKDAEIFNGFSHNGYVGIMCGFEI